MPLNEVISILGTPYLASNDYKEVPKFTLLLQQAESSIRYQRAISLELKSSALQMDQSTHLIKFLQLVVTILRLAHLQ